MLYCLGKDGEIMNLIKIEGAAVCYFNYIKREKMPGLYSDGIPTHVLDLTFCIEGEMHYILDGKNICLHSGDAILIPPGSVRDRLETDIPTLYASINLVFDHEIHPAMKGLLASCIDSNILYLLNLFEKDFSTFSERKNEKCLSAFSYIYNYICEMVCSAENSHVKAIKQYISDNLTSELTLDAIANHVHLAPQYVCSLFKKETGMTVTGFILKSRIDLAKMLILATNESICKISESCGFTDYCYFSHAFKKITGISARQYKADRAK